MSKSSANKLNEDNNSNNLCFFSPTLSLQNTKYFLESYQISNDQTLFARKFLNECPLYTKESQIPDSFYKLHKPFDRNSVFYKAHGPFGSSRKKNKFYYKENENYYPKYPLILSSSCALNKLTPNKLNKKNKSYGENNINKINEEVEKGEKDFMMKNYANKVWNMKLLQDNTICQYGPFSSKIIYQFLKNYYITLNQHEQKKMNLLISDMMYDIYYQPGTLYQMLEAELNQN